MKIDWHQRKQIFPFRPSTTFFLFCIHYVEESPFFSRSGGEFSDKVEGREREREREREEVTHVHHVLGSRREGESRRHWGLTETPSGVVPTEDERTDRDRESERVGQCCQGQIIRRGKK